ncbi:GntR family transcriptional regulator [Virgibacillus profundi]|uniref:GntR family transcriptional regulator n=1 Tax=Virgibacillus profundi TaxID=2024555 RepID=A0A2A2IGM2_9BACI|nr:GntR family transcriptional regulator [Virgibacillus profundi]PXY54566.1 FadR family transcriptional regulator [Virgibacillus profundi]
MAVTMSPKQKVYQAVLQEIRKFIEMNDLKSGDKLPSERGLSENLKAGRSSIREALRAMELLGLIETRHGEGTFLSTYRPYQTVELLSSFILQENTTRSDLMLTKRIMEKEAAKLAFSQMNEDAVEELTSLVNDSSLNPDEMHDAFFNYLFNQCDNLLLKKVWQLMDEFSQTINKQNYNTDFYEELINLYTTRNYQSIEALF